MSLLAEALQQDFSPSYTYEEIEQPDLRQLGTIIREVSPFRILHCNGNANLACFANLFHHFIKSVHEQGTAAKAVHYSKQTGYIPYLVNAYQSLPAVAQVVFPYCRLGVFKGSKWDATENHFIKWRLYVLLKDDEVLPVRYQYMRSEQEAFTPTSDYVFDPEKGKWLVYKASVEEAIYAIVKTTEAFTNIYSDLVTMSCRLMLDAKDLSRPVEILEDTTVYQQIEPTSNSAKQIRRSIQNALNSALYHPDSLARQILNYATTEKEKQK